MPACSCFLEDNGFLSPDPPRLAGSDARLQLARDQRTLYFQNHPHDSDRDYLYAVFRAVAALPAAAALFDQRHNPIWHLGISGDAATQVIEFRQRIDPGTGALVHDFTDPEWRQLQVDTIVPEATAKALEGLKFSECLPAVLATRVLRARMTDHTAVRGVLAERVKLVAE